MNKVAVCECCYRLHFDISDALKRGFHHGYDFVEKLSSQGDVLIEGGVVSIWLGPNSNKQTLLRKLHTLGVQEVYCEEIRIDDVQNKTNLFSSWFLEHYTKEELRRMEKANQEMLRDCMNRIAKARRALGQTLQKGASDERNSNNSLQG